MVEDEGGIYQGKGPSAALQYMLELGLYSKCSGKPWTILKEGH